MNLANWTYLDIHRGLSELIVCVPPLLFIPVGIWLAVIRNAPPDLPASATRKTRLFYYCRRAPLTILCLLTWTTLLLTPVLEIFILAAESMDSRPPSAPGYHWLGLAPFLSILFIWWMIFAFRPPWRERPEGKE